MDGVIVDSNPYHKLAFQAFLTKHKVLLTNNELKTNVYGRTNNEIMRYIFQDNFTQEQSEIWADEKETIFRDLYKSEVSPIKGLESFLQMLKSERVKTAIGTSAPKANLDFVLNTINFRQYFDALLHSGDVKIGKPHPDIYLKAAAILNANPIECIVIEDSLAGVKAGLNAGMKVIGITTTQSDEELANAHLVIRDFENLTLKNLMDLLYN